MIFVPVLKNLAKSLLLCLVIALSAGVFKAQVLQEPQHEQLLNGLRVLMWPRQGDQTVLIKLRIHSGAAFDLAGKSGQMTLLGDILFPDPGTREYFTDQMQGQLKVVTDYNSMTITMQGQANEFERIVDILRNAVVSTQLTPEIITSVRESRIKIAKDSTISSAMLADQAIRSRLFGDYPYGLPYAGTAESLSRVERADLMLARERFLNPNNATIAVVGGVQPNRVLRTFRQLLGIWRKSERVIPSTFRQPQPPDARTLVVNAPADQTVEIRLATRALARNDRQNASANVLAAVALQRWRKKVPELERSPMFVRNESQLLPGMFLLGATVNIGQAAKTLAAAKEVLSGLAASPVTPAEFEQAKAEVLVVTNKPLGTAEGLAEAWLDADTYKLQPPPDQPVAFHNLTPADLQQTAKRLFEKTPIATVALGAGEQVKAELERETEVELLGVVKSEAKPEAAPPAPKPAGVARPD